MPPSDRRRLFNYNKFKRRSKVYRSQHFKPQRPSNGFTPDQINKLKETFQPASLQDDIGAFQFLPLNNYGHSSRDFPPQGFAPVTDASLSRSGLKSVKIHSLLQDDPNSPQLSPIELILPSFKEIKVSEESIKLFSSANDISLTTDIQLFDQQFTDKFKDYDFDCREDFITFLSYIKMPSRIANSALDCEADVQRVADQDLFRPITDFLVDPSKTKQQEENAICSFVYRLLDLINDETMTRDQFNSIKTRFLRHFATQHKETYENEKTKLEAIVDYRELKQELKSFLKMSLIAALSDSSDNNTTNAREGAEFASNLNVRIQLVKEALLLYFGSRSIPDYSVSFTTPYAKLKKHLEFPTLSDRTRRTMSLANTCLIEMKREETRALVVIQQMLESRVLNKNGYTGLKDLIIKRSLTFTDEKVDLLLSQETLRTLVVESDSIEDEILKSDLEEINEFIHANRRGLRNLALSIGKLVSESLISNCDHMILTDYYRYLFVKICDDEHGDGAVTAVPVPVPGAVDAAPGAGAAGAAGAGAAAGVEGSGGDDSLETDVPSLLDEIPSPAMSNLKFQVFFVDSQDDSMLESGHFRFKVTAFLMDSLSKFEKTSDDFIKYQEKATKRKQDALEALALARLTKISKTTRSGNVGTEPSNPSHEQLHPAEDRFGSQDPGNDLNQAGDTSMATGGEVSLGDASAKSDPLTTSRLMLLEPPDSSSSSDTQFDPTNFTARLVTHVHDEQSSAHEHTLLNRDLFTTPTQSCSDRKQSHAKIIMANINNCIPWVLRTCQISTKSAIVSFLMSDCHPDLLKALNLPLIDPETERGVTRKQFIQRRLYLKVLIDESDNLDGFQSYYSPSVLTDSPSLGHGDRPQEVRTIGRLENEVLNLLKVNSYIDENEESAKVHSYSKLLSHGYINEVSTPIPGLQNALPECLSMLSGPFILMEGASEGHSSIQFPLNPDIIQVLTMAQKEDIIQIFRRLHEEIHLVHKDVREDNILVVYDTTGLSMLSFSDFSCYEDIKEGFDVSRILGFQLIDFEMSEPISDPTSEESTVLIEREMKALYWTLHYVPT